jgi:outer membrane lipoprotein SlyB
MQSETTTAAPKARRSDLLGASLGETLGDLVGGFLGCCVSQALVRLSSLYLMLHVSRGKQALVAPKADTRQIFVFSRLQ